MRLGNYDIQSPMLLGGEMSEAEVLGASVWLWMHSSAHRDYPLHTLPTLLLPAIKRQQYALACRDGKPMFYLSWMWLHEEAERRYLTKPHILTRNEDWASGEQLWLRDVIAPFGDVMPLRHLVTGALFPEHCFRSLWHRGETRGKRVINFRGARITPQQARAWREAHPLAAPVRETFAGKQP